LKVRNALCALLGAAALAACTTDNAARQQTGPAFDAVWQSHHATLDYFGLTTLYSCNGLEQKVRELLLYLGARPDLKVQARGCNRGFNVPGHLASVAADFHTLAPASGSAAGAAGSTGSVPARWTVVTIKPMVPIWMGYGECELMQQLEPVVTRDFSARDLHYHTACVPRDVTIADYRLTGEFPKASRR